MGVTTSYGALLKRYMPEELIENEFKQKNYIWANIEKDFSWGGGVYEVPFLSAGFSTVQYGSLAAANDIAEAVPVMGTIASQKELTATLIVNEGDLSRHVDMQKSYLKIVPDRAEKLIQKMQEHFSVSVLRGVGVLSMATANGAVGGTISVADPEMFEVKQKVEVIDNDTAAATGYIQTIDVNSGALLIHTTRPGGTAVDLSLYTTAQSARVRIVGAGTESFLDLKSALLPASLGGSDTIYGVTKSGTPAAQAFRADGSAFTAATIVKDLLGAWAKYQKLGRGKASEIWVGYGMFKNIAAALEVARQYVTTAKTTNYGFNSLTLVGADGEVKIVALREMPTDVAYIVDWSGLTFAGIPIKKNLYGNDEYFLVRNTTGIQYISDFILRGDLVVRPQRLGCIYNIPSTVSA